MLVRIVFLIIEITCVSTAKILGVFPLPGVSHHILASKLMIGLVDAGHDVTMITPFKLGNPPKNGNYTEILLEGLKESFDEYLNVYCNLSRLDALNPVEAARSFREKMVQITNTTFHHPHIKKLLKWNMGFDAVIIEQTEGLKISAHIFNCPLITLGIFGPNPWINPSVGNPQIVSYIPHTLIPSFSKDSIFDRAKNMIMYILDYYNIYYNVFPRFEKIIHQAFPIAPSINDLSTNVSLVLLNSHISLFAAVPLVPNMVEIGGYFIDPPKKLSLDLQNFLDSAKDGAIYFSMGSNLRSKDFSEATRKMILNVFKNLKQKILWKFEEDLPGKSTNVMIRKWLPQQDILAHPNIKLFIMQGGILSIMESIYNGIPLLVIPLFLDQPTNANRVVQGGYGLKLEYTSPEFTEENFEHLINELLNNSKYKQNARMRSEMYHDRPQKPMDTAIFWIEYVIRHKGAPHLRVAGIRMPWYNYFMVDVIGAVIFSIFIIFLSLKVVLNKVCCWTQKTTFNRRKVKVN